MAQQFNKYDVEQALESMQQAWRTMQQAYQSQADSPLELRQAPDFGKLRQQLDQRIELFGLYALALLDRGGDLEILAPPQTEEGEQAQPTHRVAPPTARTSPPSRASESRSSEPPECEEDPRAGATPIEVAREQIEDFLEKTETLRPLTSTANAIEELNLVDARTSEEAMEMMIGWPARARILAIEHLAARTRAVQDAQPNVVEMMNLSHLAVLFGRMSEHLKIGWPGRAHGLARNHTPRTYTWTDDAKELHEELSVLLQTKLSA